MKKEYLKPTIQVVLLDYQAQLLTVSRIENIGFEGELDDIILGEYLVGDGFDAR